VLEIDRLHKRYPNGVTALDGISLSVPRGMFGLLGPNGAGKSTLMRTLATLQAADAGSARLEDVDLLNDVAGTRAILGYLPQDFGLYPQLSARAMLDHLAVLKGIGPAARRRMLVDEMLDLTNLYAVRDRALGTFSGGMRQRFGIAQALLGSPRLLIVDEPTAGLDPTERNRFHNLLVRISGEMVVLLSTHIVEDVDDLCPNMAIMNRGRLVAVGTPGGLRADLAGRIWARRMSQADAEDAARRHAVLSTRLSQGVSEIHVLADASPGEGFEPIEPDLEDVYFAALHRDERERGDGRTA
jgi:ABC-type multidrug transport system ATPase subunit